MPLGGSQKVLSPWKGLGEHGRVSSEGVIKSDDILKSTLRGGGSSWQAGG